MVESGHGLIYYPGIFRERPKKDMAIFSQFNRSPGRELEYPLDMKQSATQSTGKFGQYRLRLVQTVPCRWQQDVYKLVSLLLSVVRIKLNA